MHKNKINTPKEIQEEIERCKDFVYFYNNYVTVNGEQPKPITHEEYNSIINYYPLKLRKQHKDIF
jgi:hypothetical protein